MSYKAINSKENSYFGGTSSGPGWTIRWKGPYQEGITPIETVEAIIENLKHRQSTDVASNEDAKLLFALTKAKEEYHNDPPTMGGELNNLIPE